MRRATFKAGRLARAAMSGAGLIMAAGHCAFAQTVSVPSLATSPLPHIMPQTPTTLGKGLPDFSKTGTEGPLPAVSIQVHSASIVGATAFPAAKLNGMIAGLAGQSVPLTKLEAARLALVRLYRSHGYILSTVTLDVSATGDVRFVVTEGYVTNVKLSKDIGPAGTLSLIHISEPTRPY